MEKDLEERKVEALELIGSKLEEITELLNPTEQEPWPVKITDVVDVSGSIDIENVNDKIEIKGNITTEEG